MPIPQNWTVKQDYQDIVKEAIFKDQQMQYYLYKNVEEKEYVQPTPPNYIEKERKLSKTPEKSTKLENEKKIINSSIIEEEIENTFLLTATKIKKQESILELPLINLKTSLKNIQNITKNIPNSPSSKKKNMLNSKNFNKSNLHSDHENVKKIFQQNNSRNSRFKIKNSSSFEMPRNKSAIEYNLVHPFYSKKRENKFKIKNRKVLSLLLQKSENGIYSPYFSRCKNCNERNNDFYDKITQANAIGILNSIREGGKY